MIIIKILVILPAVLNAQDKEVITQQGYTLTVVNNDATFDNSVKTQLIDTFFEVYPLLTKTYNKHSIKEITFLIDTAYHGVAEAGGGVVRYSSAWFHKHPADIDVVTHEVMHIVQSYPGDAGPGWITEGIADYVRYKFGLSNEVGGWRLPEFTSGHHYSNSYRIAARFFVWLEKNEKKGIVKTIDEAMRNKTFTENIWKQETGKTLDELWKSYSDKPAI
ncbi:basic secretory family protein [Chryseosolibacter indicus]|uniref:basic secretory family protein n=1 Tax=Chryseosolibacter indicus TaxID=2782351 RepID=UPI0020B2669C|nr:basic secretory family protein [Chryseosolibacter indicus]